MLPSSEPRNDSSPLIFDSGYARTTRELVQFMTNLRALGAQTSLDLPRIVVIGNQSAGKSSLVEAISGIALPRDAGTCTRCPMECRLAQSSDPWSCQILIRWEFDSGGNRLDEVEEVPFGQPLTDTAEVEVMLRRAQSAILNPDLPLSHFIDSDLETPKNGNGKAKSFSRPLAFSRNVICIDISGPELIDLSFVDLPGIVQNAEPKIVQLVEDLVTSYVGGNCLILVTLPMSDDIENQKAALIAKHADPHGLRTIGVLTKPDTLPNGATKSREMWLDVMGGRCHPLKHGYYCTRQPDDDKRFSGISPAMAREEEAEFFKRTAPWSTSTLQGRLGIPNLVKNISELLTNIIRDSLPKLLGEVTSQLSLCKQELDALPPVVTTEPTSFVFNLIVGFCDEVLKHIRGSPARARLVQANKRTYEALKKSIRSTAPQFIPFESDGMPEGTDPIRFFTVDDDIQHEIEVDLDPELEFVGGESRFTPGKPFYLGDVRQHMQSCVTRELPLNVPYEAKMSFIRDFQQSWESNATRCFDEVHETFKKTLLEIVKRKFARFDNLKAIAMPIIMDRLQAHAQQAAGHVRMILELEKGAPFTQNDHYLSAKREQQLLQYRQARSGRGADSESASSDSDSDSDNDECSESDAVKKALTALQKLGYDVKEEDLKKLNPPDEYEEELLFMAEVRAYFQVAYKRVIDYVPLAIDHHFLYAFPKTIQGVLLEKLGLGSPNAEARCASYIAEEAEVTARRQELMKKKKRLENIQQALFNFGL